MKRLFFALMSVTLMSVTVLAGGGTAIAADLEPYYRAPPPVLVPLFTWTGFYVGGNVGGAATSINELWSPLPSSATFGAFPITGSTGGASFAGGFQAGYNWQFAPTWVAGIEGDWSWANATGNINQPWVLNSSGVVVPGSFTSMSSTLEWVSSIRVRLGYLVTPTLMAYGTAGGTWGKIDYAASSFAPATPPPPYATSAAFSNTQGGWVAGAGLEWAFTPNWLLRGEYLFYSLSGFPSVVAPSANYPALPSGYSWSNTNVGVARLGLSYKF
jgi:outer membrane immunogenic protein